MNQTIDEFFHIKNSEKQWNDIYTLGGIATFLALTGISLDVVIGNIKWRRFVHSSTNSN